MECIVEDFETNVLRLEGKSFSVYTIVISAHHCHISLPSIMFENNNINDCNK